MIPFHFIYNKSIYNMLVFHKEHDDYAIVYFLTSNKNVTFLGYDLKLVPNG